MVTICIERILFSSGQKQTRVVMPVVCAFLQTCEEVELVRLGQNFPIPVPETHAKRLSQHV
jgi:hypothetical protein